MCSNEYAVNAAYSEFHEQRKGQAKVGEVKPVMTMYDGRMSYEEYKAKHEAPYQNGASSLVDSSVEPTRQVPSQ